VPFKGRSTFSAVINSTESKTDTPTLDSSSLWEQDNQFLIPGYASSKLRAENIVLNSNGAPLQNQHGEFNQIDTKQLKRNLALLIIIINNPIKINQLK